MIWSISKNNTSLSISVDGTTILSWDVNTSEGNSCTEIWREKIEYLEVGSSDTASNAIEGHGGWSMRTDDGSVIDWDFTSHPLRLLTVNSLTAVDDDALSIHIRLKLDNNVWKSLEITLSNPLINFSLDDCGQNTFSSSLISTKAKKIWSVTKTDTFLLVHCEEVLLFRVEFSESPECADVWLDKSIESFDFNSEYDTATVGYRKASE